jgi:hypothetical protein
VGQTVGELAGKQPVLPGFESLVRNSLLNRERPSLPE